MAGFGGSVKLTGESEYQRALQQINQALRETTSQMKAVSSAYDKNDHSQAALSAKAAVLNQKLSEQKQKLALLKSEYQNMQSQYAQNTAKHQQLVNEYNKEKQKLDEIGRTLGTTSNEYQQQKAKVDELAQELRKSTAAQDENEKSMSKMRIEINNTEAACNKTAREIDNLGKETKEAGTDAKQASEGFTVFKGILANLASSAITAAISGLRRLGSEMVGIGKQAIDLYAEFEQLEGGSKLMFGDDVYYSTVAKNAQEAYKTVQLSQNEYLQQVNGFATGLTTALGGNQQAAAELAHKIVKAEADVVAATGRTQEDVQNAFNGVMRGNYQMLDNLQIGITPTKEGLQQVIDKVNDWNAAQGNATNYQMGNYADMEAAIVDYVSMVGLSGYASREAGDTIQGSLSSTKAAWENLVSGMANEDVDFGQLVSNFTDSLVPTIDQIAPRILQVIEGLGQLAQGLLTTVLPQLMPVITDLVTNVATGLVELTPTLISAGLQLLSALAQGFAEAIPQIMEMLPGLMLSIVQAVITSLPALVQAGNKIGLSIIQGLGSMIGAVINKALDILVSIINTIIENLSMVIQSAVQIMQSLIKGLQQSIGQLIAYVPKIVQAIVQTIQSKLSSIISVGKQVITSFVNGIKSMIGAVRSAISNIASTIVSTLQSIPGRVASVGRNIVQGIWNGISGSLGWIKSKITGWVGDVTSFLKNLFGIHSPSTLMRDEVGVFLARGIGVGFEQEMANVAADMANAVPTNFDVNSSVTGYGYQEGMVAAFVQALGQVKIVLDDEVAGEFVDKTVTRLIYV